MEGRHVPAPPLVRWSVAVDCCGCRRSGNGSSQRRLICRSHGHHQGHISAADTQQGRFLIQGLPAGRYLIAAVDFLEPGAERSASTPERLRRGATALVLADDESKSIELRLAQ
jgi:hypothetical protein